jgi:3-oxoacyl-[acyl-carrier protein] reductase
MHFPELRGRVALVTGAGRRGGIGDAVCRELAGQGCPVFFTSNKQSDLLAHGDEADPGGPTLLLEKLRSMGGPAEFLDIDLADPFSTLRLTHEVECRLGPMFILVNNAAYSSPDGYARLDAETLDRHYAVNVRAPALLSVSFARRFDGRAGGRIINLTSGQDLGPMPGELAYAATKGAISAFTRSLAREVAAKGMTVNAVDPGPTDTGGITSDLRARLVQENGRIGLPQDAANLVTFLASDAAAWVNGQILHSRGA